MEPIILCIYMGIAFFTGFKTGHAVERDKACVAQPGFVDCDETDHARANRKPSFWDEARKKK